MTNRTPPRPLLEGLRVIDLSLWQPGHTATQLLADLGADVLKVEPPGGDRMRPLVDRFYNYNGRKRSTVLDLKDDAGRQRLLGLAADAEVVVENYRPGVAARLGIGFDDLVAVNPSIVMCSITGFGQTGPLAGVPGHDHNFQAFAGGFTFPDGGPPAPAGHLVGDQGGGMAAAFAILAAVLCARRTGQGEHIDVAITDLLATWVAPMGSIDPRRLQMTGGGSLPGMGVFRTADDEYVELGIFSEDHLWDLMCDALGLAEHVGVDMAGRAARASELRAAVAERMQGWKRDEIVELLTRRSVPVAPVLTRVEMLEHPNFHERGIVATGPDGYRVIAHPIRYAVHPALPPGRPPTLDEHPDARFGEPDGGRDDGTS
ncbi:MAG: CaiB/BaiF CoA transferase family protein [Acidimicrobiia bacterium]